MYLTYDKYEKKISELNSKYWNEGKKYRWQYIFYTIEQLKQICPDDSKLIEAGTSGMPLSDRSFLYEYPMYDLNVVPYGGIKFSNKTFDAFVALQVWEHLDNQSAAFQEVMRIAKSAILSFPYKWTWGDSRHKGITAKKIEQWTCGVVPESIRIINHRAIYTWRFEK